jgi:hypothetical protein
MLAEPSPLDTVRADPGMLGGAIDEALAGAADQHGGAGGEARL